MPRVIQAVFACLVVVSAGRANAQIVTLDLQWSGASFGNSASATGTITIDESLMNNPGFSVTTFVTDFSITVTGASAGNGTFTLADFSSIFLNTGGGTLDFTQDLIGQPTPGLPWGPGGAGDFNFFNSNALAPSGFVIFQIRPSGSSDILQLTSFAPSAVPEPSTFAMLAIGAIGGIAYYRRRKRQAAPTLAA